MRNALIVPNKMDMGPRYRDSLRFRRWQLPGETHPALYLYLSLLGVSVIWILAGVTSKTRRFEILPGPGKLG